MPRAVAYIRVSTTEQATEGISLEAQEARVRAYCEMRGLDLVAVVVDAGVSAGKPLQSREGGRQVLDLVAARECEAVVAFKLDRLFRDCVDCLQTTREWDRKGVSLHLLDLGGQALDTSSALGRFFLTVMAGAAELERAQIGERTSAAMSHKRQNGGYVGGMCPYGFRRSEGGELVEDPAEQEVISAARAARADGLSLRAVSRELARQGFTARTGKQFAPNQIRRFVA